MDWQDERYEDAVWAARVKEGRCGNCGAFDGQSHRCPPRGGNDLAGVPHTRVTRHWEQR